MNNVRYYYCCVCVVHANRVSCEGRVSKWCYLFRTSKSWVNFEYGRLVHVVQLANYKQDIYSWCWCSDLLYQDGSLISYLLSVAADGWHLPSLPENSQWSKLVLPGRLLPALGAAYSKCLSQVTKGHIPFFKVAPTIWSSLCFRVFLRIRLKLRSN